MDNQNNNNQNRNPNGNPFSDNDRPTDPSEKKINDKAKHTGNAVRSGVGAATGSSTMGKVAGKVAEEASKRRSIRREQHNARHNVNPSPNGKQRPNNNKNDREQTGNNLNLKDKLKRKNPFNQFQRPSQRFNNSGGNSDTKDKNMMNNAQDKQNASQQNSSDQTEEQVKGAVNGLKKVLKTILKFLLSIFSGFGCLGGAVLFILIFMTVFAVIVAVILLFSGDGSSDVAGNNDTSIHTDQAMIVAENKYYERLQEIYEQYKKPSATGISRVFAWLSTEYGYGVEIDTTLITATLFSSQYLGDTLNEDAIEDFYSEDCDNGSNSEDSSVDKCYKDIFSSDFNSEEEDYYGTATDEDVNRVKNATQSIEILAKYMIEDLGGGHYRLNCAQYKEKLSEGKFLKAYYKDYVKNNEDVDNMVDTIYDVVGQFDDIASHSACLSAQEPETIGDRSCVSSNGGGCEYDNMPIRLTYCSSYGYSNPRAGNNDFPGGYDSSIGASAQTISWDNYIVGVVSREIDPSANEEAIKLQMIMAKAESYYRLTQGHSGFDMKNGEVWMPIDADCHQIYRNPDTTTRQDIVSNRDRLYSIYNSISNVMVKNPKTDTPMIIYGNKFQTAFQQWAKQGTLYTEMFALAYEQNIILSGEGGGIYAGTVFKDLTFRTCANAPINSGSAITAPSDANIVQSADSNTIKVSIEEVSRENRTSYFVTRIWMQNPANQIKKAVPASGSLSPVKSILNNAISTNNLGSKVVVGANASGYYGESNCYDSSSVAIGRLIITDGKMIRNDYANSSCGKSHPIYGIDSSGNLRVYADKTSLNATARKTLFESVTTAGVKNTFSFVPILVENGKVTTTNNDGQNIRHGLCQVDSNNYIMITDKYANSRTGFGIKELAETMVALGCKTGVNFDGGGSSTLYFKSSNGALNAVMDAESRRMPDAIYFTE